ncbi:MAG: hypothetical protein ACR2GZ_09150 [Solirubrobacteraceae bacterium]
MRRAVGTSGALRALRAATTVSAALVAWLVPAAAGAQVLRVGTYQGIPGQFSSIQAAVNVAKPGDKILVGPGDYKTTDVHAPAGAQDTPAAVLITTGGLTLRGMDRNAVTIDGTKPGSPRCSAVKGDQGFGAPVASSASGSAQYGSARTAGAPSGINGVEIYKAPNVAVENLNTCNFLGGAANTGNGVWWNGGDGSGKIGGHGYYGSYLTATSTFFQDNATAAKYGIFSSNWSGGAWDQMYASNFNDSGFYIGACQQVCDQTVNHVRSQYSALGYSGTNSGGRLVIENSEFDHNQDGFDTNSQNADEPSPQNGACPAGVTPPIAGASTCWVFTHNYVHDNNNPNVPAAGTAAAGPVGTGMSLSGGQNDTIINNRFENNGAWGLIVVPFPDNGPPCTGGTETQAACIFDESGIAVLNNSFKNNGGFGNPSNGDIAATNLEAGPTDCYRGNTDGSGAASTSPATLQQQYPSCNGQTVPPNQNPVFLSEVACDSQSIQVGPASGGTFCPPGANYPRHAAGQPMPPVPSGLPTMPHVCSGVAVDPWCNDYVADYPRCAGKFVSTRLTLNSGETFTGVTARVNRRRAIYRRAHGSQTRVRFRLTSARHRRVRVRFVMHMNVNGHSETTRFTRIYHRC